MNLKDDYRTILRDCVSACPSEQKAKDFCEMLDDIPARYKEAGTVKCMTVLKTQLANKNVTNMYPEIWKMLMQAMGDTDCAFFSATAYAEFMNFAEDVTREYDRPTPAQKFAQERNGELYQRIMESLSWLSPDRLFLTIQQGIRYDNRHLALDVLLNQEYPNENFRIKNKMVPGKLTHYDTCVNQELDPLQYLSPYHTDPLQILNVISECLLKTNGSYHTMRFAEDPAYNNRYKIQTLAALRYRYPDSADWLTERILKPDAPIVVYEEISDKAMKSFNPLNDHGLTIIVQETKQRWEGFTYALETVYRNRLKVSRDELYDTWQADMIRYNANGTELGLILLTQWMQEASGKE